MEVIFEPVTTGGELGKWNYDIISDIVEKKIKESIKKNIDTARKIAASTSKRACVRLRFKKKTVTEIAERSKSGKLPSYKMTAQRISRAVRQQLGLKARRDGDDLLVILSPSDLQRYISEIEEE